jgi:hypothetical protein
MNEQLQELARASLKESLASLPESNQRLFKLMYGRNGGRRSVEEAEVMSIDAVVDEMEAKSLDWAMTQVANTIVKGKKNG